MQNDKTTSELISRSFSGAVTAEQKQQIEEEIAANEQSRNFAALSRLIHDSLSDIGERTRDGDESVAAGLSQAARSRLKSSIRQESARLNNLGATMVGDTTNKPAMMSRPAALEEPEDRTLASRFVLTRKIGKGGLGTVWLAKDEKLQRSVALKEMNPEAAEFPRAWERFQREAEITGQLEHPNVVPLYQFGMDRNTGQPFYAMRFVGKKTLVDAIEAYHDRKEAGEDVTMDLHHLLTAFIGVCQAIAYAHSRGVIHRDLKPENVALDNFGQVIVLDWGLAKVTDDFESDGALSGVLSDHSSAGKTMAGEVIGTPLYMAPEQAAGRLDDIDPRTDVYGLGAILFAMLTGAAPHQNSSMDNGSSVPIPDLLKNIAEQPTPMVREYRSDIPADLAHICEKAMQFKAHSRYQSALDVAEAVQQWMAGRSERRQKYANSRSEGRELRAAMLSAIRDLERNARFMSSLPPIQGIVNAVSDRDGGDDISVWRERLAVIYKGLLKTNSDFSAVSYASADGTSYKELIRLERQASDSSNVRSIPASRLASGDLTFCMQKALEGNPDEVYVALSSECPPPGEARKVGRITAAVPVFDEVTEEVFGFVMIEACLEQLIEAQIRGRFRSINQLYVLDNDCRILMQIDNTGTRVRQNDGVAMSDLSPCWSKVVPHLKGSGEFIDEQDHAFYATRVDLVPGRYSLALAMCLAEKPQH
ncbi:MAG: serine/threonine protein kinase [Planctomycetaceae bacterium]|nr:serine/threonine protein kinase [Planctomycetaceae bacterium]